MSAPTTVVLFGATGDLSKRKLIPGLCHLFLSGLLDDLQLVGTSLDDLNTEAFRDLASASINEFSGHGGIAESDLVAFLQRVTYVPISAGPQALAEAARAAAKQFDTEESGLLHYLSVPPKAARAAINTIAAAGLVQGSRVIMEKPFGVNLASAVELNREIHEVFDESQVFRIDHFLGKEAAQNILAFRFANGLFEPIWHRNNIDHIQIDVPETLGLSQRGDFYEQTGAFRDMVVTHLFQIMAFTAMEPPTSLQPHAISREKNKVFESMLPLEPHNVVRGQYNGYLAEPGVKFDSDTETFVALKCYIDNWRWAGVPFYLRTGKRMAEGARIISIAFKEPPRAMFPQGSGVGDHGPDHLTFDLSDNPKMSLSFYGKRPGPGYKLDKLSMQFSMQDTHWAGSVLEAYERLIYDAARGDRTLFTSADGIERLWEISEPLLNNPPVVRPYEPGTYGPNQIHQLIAPFTWRLPFERKWREQKKVDAKVTASGAGD